MQDNWGKVSRRSFFKKAVFTSAIAGGSLVTSDDLEAITGRVNTNSQPSDLKITDMRITKFNTSGLHSILRLDTNQGISGYGEFRGNASTTHALMLKSRLLGRNPCHVDKLFRKIKQFGNHGTQSAGISAIEIALWDLAGTAWGVPVWQLLGGKFRDKIRVYTDTPRTKDPAAMGKTLKDRMQRGYTFLKMDIGIRELEHIEGTLTYPKGQGVTPSPKGNEDYFNVAHPFTGIRVTEKGLKILREYCATVRDMTGWEIPIATDHFGHIAVEDCIKIARSLDQFNFAWYEDMIPWYYTDQYVRLKNSCTTPVLTGEDIYLKEGFKNLFEKKAISMCHPDITAAGGILESKKISDLAMEYGIGSAIHQGGSAVKLIASVHCAAASENFLCLEHHGVDKPGYDDFVDGISKPIVKDGFIPVPNGPGLGIELNEETVKKLLKDPKKEYFPPTREWDNEKARDRLWTLSRPMKNNGQS